MHVGDLVELIGSSRSNKDNQFLILSVEYKCDALGLYPYEHYTLLNMKTKQKITIKIWHIDMWNDVKFRIIKHSCYSYLYSIYYSVINY
jgi:hypothetical protein